MIHPTALIDPKAQIPASAEIGPNVLIEGAVELGEDCVVQANAVLTGQVKLGARNMVGYGAIIGSLPQDLGFKPETPTGVEIGDDNVLREYCTVHRATQPGACTRIGSGNYLMTGAHLAHDVHIGNRCILANNCLLGGHVHFGDNIVIGGGAVFHQFVRVGSYVMVQGNSAVGQDLPPFVMAAELNCVSGLNVVGMRRAGLSAGVRAEIKKAFQTLYTSGLNTSQALEQAEAQSWGTEAAYFWEFIRNAKKRGICAHARRPRRGPGSEDKESPSPAT